MLRFVSSTTVFQQKKKIETVVLVNLRCNEESKGWDHKRYKHIILHDSNREALNDPTAKTTPPVGKHDRADAVILHGGPLSRSLPHISNRYPGWRSTPK